MNALVDELRGHYAMPRGASSRIISKLTPEDAARVNNDFIKERVARKEAREDEAYRMFTVEQMTRKQIAHAMNLPVQMVSRYILRRVSRASA